MKSPFQLTNQAKPNAYSGTPIPLRGGGSTQDGTFFNGTDPSYATIASTSGAGEYLFMTNNIAGCDNISSSTSTPQSGFAFVRLSSTGEPTYYDGQVYQQTPITIEYTAGLNTSYETRFTNLAFSGTTAQISYFLDSTEILPNRADRNPTHVRLSYSKQPTTDFTALSNPISTTTNVIGSTTVSLSALTNGVYDILVQFSNLGVPFGGAVPFPEAYIYTQIQVTGGTITIIGSTQFYNNRNQIPPTEKQPCGITDLSGCIVNALAFVFVPSASSTEAFTSINNDLAGKFPFAYLYDAASAMSSVFTLSQTNNTSISVPFLNTSIPIISASTFANLPQASLIRGFLVAFLWLAFLGTMYRRTYRIFNPAIS